MKIQTCTCPKCGNNHFKKKPKNQNKKNPVLILNSTGKVIEERPPAETEINDRNTGTLQIPTT